MLTKTTNKELRNELIKDTKYVIQEEMFEIKKWLSDNDYIINKHTLGEYSNNDEKWLNYIAERKVKLNRYNELEMILNNK